MSKLTWLKIKSFFTLTNKHALPIMERAYEVFGNKYRTWYYYHFPAIGCKPCDIAWCKEGKELLLDELERIKNGLV